MRYQKAPSEGLFCVPGNRTKTATGVNTTLSPPQRTPGATPRADAPIRTEEPHLPQSKAAQPARSTQTGALATGARLLFLLPHSTDLKSQKTKAPNSRRGRKTHAIAPILEMYARSSCARAVPKSLIPPPPMIRTHAPISVGRST